MSRAENEKAGKLRFLMYQYHAGGGFTASEWEDLMSLLTEMYDAMLEVGGLEQVVLIQQENASLAKDLAELEQANTELEQELLALKRMKDKIEDLVASVKVGP